MVNNYKTEQRKMIIKYLMNENKEKFVNAEEILNYLKSNNQIVGLTTIYRFLNLLEKNNNVRIEIKNHTKYYQYITNECSNHFHLKCKKCGKTIHLNCKEFENVNKHIKKEHNFNLDYNTIIYGTCSNCTN